MHATNKRRVQRQNKQRAELVAQLVSGHTPYGRIEPLTRPVAEKVIAEELDLWAWTQGRVQFLSPAEIRAAARCGLHSWIEAAVNGSDSADSFFTINGGWDALLEIFPSALSIQTRCAGARDGGHSCWTYGPVFVSPKAAKAEGFTHRIDCGCGRSDKPL